jgi:RHS repeat-associated protein
MKNNAHHFTGKERDSESGNDYFGARYYSSAMGRFMSPDYSESPMPVPYADLENPQTLNLYAYVENNPLKTVDETGHDSGCNWICKIRQFFETPEEVTAEHRQWLIDNATTDADKKKFENATDDEVNSTYEYYNEPSFKTEVDADRAAKGIPEIGGDYEYEPNPKHGPTPKGNVSAAPKDGQDT